MGRVSKLQLSGSCRVVSLDGNEFSKLSVRSEFVHKTRDLFRHFGIKRRSSHQSWRKLLVQKEVSASQIVTWSGNDARGVTFVMRQHQNQRNNGYHRGNKTDPNGQWPSWRVNRVMENAIPPNSVSCFKHWHKQHVVEYWERDPPPR